MIAYAVERKPALAMLTGAFGGIGAVLLLFVLARAVDEALPWALFCAALAYTTSLVTRGSSVDEAVPLVATGLLLCGELAAWSLEERLPIAAERSVLAARAVAVGALAASGLAVATTVVALTAAPAGGGLGWTAAGALAAVLAVATAVRVARR